jgi:flagella basal body P-ring formation protein FlgA
MISKRLLIVVLGLLQAASAANQRPSVCLAVHGESILAGDLAVANPVFASLDPQLIMGPSPMAGARRDYRSLELASLVRRHSLPSTALHEVCFEWPTQPLVVRLLAEAMARVLECDAGAVEIIEQSRFPTPPGELVFAREDLVQVPGSGGRLQLWRGFVRYGTARRFPVWARVRIALPAVRIVALATLLAGQPIQEEQLERRVAADASVGGVFAVSVNEVAGRVAATRIEPGTAIRIADLKLKPDVAAGDEVQLEVRNGGMRVYGVARAEQSGRLGDTIPVTNLQSSAHFRARVEGKDRVSLTLQPRESRK